MKKLRTAISVFSIFLLTSGLLATGFQLHELSSLQKADSAHGIQVIESHTYCPVCYGIFSFNPDASALAQFRAPCGMEEIVFEDLHLSSPFSFGKKGRSPPLQAG